MKLQVFCCFLLLLFTLISCNDKDKEFSLSGRLLSIEETNSIAINIPTKSTKYVFEYDSRGRVKKVNDKTFEYGNNGKVSSSRIHRVENKSYGTTLIETEYIEQINYYWDSQGRLNTIVMDSLVQWSRSSTDGALNSFSKSIAGDVVLATYEYIGSAYFPSQITYRRILDDLGTQKTIGLEEKAIYSYAGDLVESSKLSQPKIAMLPINITQPSNQIWTIFSFFRYSDTSHYLYGIYRQLGFHPYHYEEVVPSKIASTWYRRVEIGNDHESGGPDWTKGITNHIAYNAEGLPIKVSSDIVITDEVFTHPGLKEIDIAYY